MNKLLSFSIVALLFLFSVGCAKMPLRGDYVEEKSPPQIQADEQSAAIVFFREWAFTGGGMSYFITEDTNNIGLLKAGSYFAYRAPLANIHIQLKQKQDRPSRWMFNLVRLITSKVE